METVEDEDNKGYERPVTQAIVDKDGKGEQIGHHPPDRNGGNQPGKEKYTKD